MKHVNLLMLFGALTVHSFAGSQVFSKQSLTKLPLAFASAFKSTADSSDCTLDQITLYSNSNKSIQFLSFTPCSKSPEAQMNNGDYPPLFWLYKNDILPIDLWDYGFMYASGEILQFTDLNNNQMPELWLTGDVCECDGDPEDFGPEGCNCTDTTVVELSPNTLEISSNSKFTDWEKDKEKWVHINQWDKEKLESAIVENPRKRVNAGDSKPVKTTSAQLDSTIAETQKGDPAKRVNLSDRDNLFGSEPVRTTAYLYQSAIMSRIEQNWSPTGQSKLPVILEYTVNPNGTLGKVILVNSSGNKMLDMQAKRAIEMAFPMHPIPKEISENPFKRTCTIYSNKR